MMNDILNISMQDVLNEALFILNNLHFIRADWFYAFVPLIIFLLISYRAKLNNKNWLSVIDPQLLPFVLSQSHSKQRRYPLLIIFIACCLCITALAGPVYKKLPQPVYREQSSLVVILDLSQSMNASDIRPSRLSRAKLKLLDLLKTRKAGQTALIVYAADAFVVTPLTDDNKTIANLVPSLETDMMPAQGSNLSSALAKTFSLFTQSGIVKGNILVLTDDIRPGEESAIKKVFSQGHRLSIFGIGTTGGAPIPLSDSDNGGFLKDSNGAIVIAKLFPGKLHSYALNGGGLYTSLQADDSDIEKLNHLFQSSEVNREIENDGDINNINADIWQEEGHWLLLPLLLFAALWARRGWITSVLVLISVTSLVPQPVYAAQEDILKPYINTSNLWFSDDQKAMKAFNRGDTENAAEKFTTPEWKASAYYRNGDYEAAAKTLEKTDNSDGFYNKANALANLGKYEEAIKAYDQALELDENNDDASYNREQVSKALQEQQEQQQQGQQQDDQQQDEKDQDKSDQQQSDQDGQKQDKEQDNQQESDEQDNSENNDSQKQDSQQQDSQQENQSEEQQSEQQSAESQENRQAEEEQLKQRDAEAEAKQQQQQQKNYQQHQKDQNQEQQMKGEDQQEQKIENKEGEEKPAEIEVNPLEASITEEEKATEQWLKRIPDDPAGLLRRKFLYQYKNIPNQTDADEPW